VSPRSGRSTLVVPLDDHYLVVERVGSVGQSDLEKLRALPPDILGGCLGRNEGRGKTPEKPQRVRRDGGRGEGEAQEVPAGAEKGRRRPPHPVHDQRPVGRRPAQGALPGKVEERRTASGTADTSRGRARPGSLRVCLHLAAVTLALYNAWQLERTRGNRLRAEDAAQRLSHTLEHAALILLRDALATLTQALQNLTGATGTTVSAELLRTVSESNPLHAQVLRVVLTREKPPPQAGNPPPAKEREVMAPAG